MSSPSSWQNCFAAAPEIQLSGTADVTFTPLDLQLGDADNGPAGADVGPSVGIEWSGGEFTTNGTSWTQYSSLGVCFGLTYDAGVNIGPLSFDVDGSFPDPPVQFYGTGVPLR